MDKTWPRSWKHTDANPRELAMGTGNGKQVQIKSPKPETNYNNENTTLTTFKHRFTCSIIILSHNVLIKPGHRLISNVKSGSWSRSRWEESLRICRLMWSEYVIAGRERTTGFLLLHSPHMQERRMYLWGFGAWRGIIFICEGVCGWRLHVNPCAFWTFHPYLPLIKCPI